MGMHYQVSVFGTEESSGCFDYRGAGEELGNSLCSRVADNKTGRTETSAYMASHTKGQHNGKPRHWLVNISRQ